MKYYVVDAFAEQVFSGNPAGVCVLETPLDASVMQSIASENNLSETAFIRGKDGCYDLRWFTPELEIDLCGHATLGSAFVVMNCIEPGLERVEFMTQSGRLTVVKDGGLYRMDFPSRMPAPCPVPELLEKALGASVLETHLSRDLAVLADSEAAVRNLKPDFALLRKIPGVFAFIVTAKGETCDFVSRFFMPDSVIIEDPVTGSAHSTLIPFWSKRLQKTAMTARQLSPRGGTLYCKDCGERVEISGTAVLYLEGEIRL